MAETDYKLLTIVGAVAALAILGMTYLSAQGMVVQEPMTPTGNFVADATADFPVRAPRAVLERDAPDFDLTGDGVVDDRDLSALIRAMDSRCPAEKTCDVNADGVFDVRDTAALADLVLEERASAPAPVPVRSAPGLVRLDVSPSALA